MFIKQTPISLNMRGHLKIIDDLGEVHCDKDNAIHPQNLARVFARALSNERNYYINRIAFGNGGTTVDGSNNIIYKTPNDGQSPDTATWESRIYHETFSKIIDDGQTTLNPLIGVDPGSADLNTGVRPGGGSVPSSDPTTIPNISGPGVRSTDMGIISSVVISSVVNADEPKSQYLVDNAPELDGTFVFDEIGLYTSGAPAIATNGYQFIDVGNKTSVDDTGLVRGGSYAFNVAVDGGSPVLVSFTTPLVGGTGPTGEILYGDLCEAINTGDAAWGFTGSSPLPYNAIVSITDNTGGVYPSITSSVTYGYLQFSSGTSGANSSITITDPSHTFVNFLNPPSGAVLQPAVVGKAAGLQNAPTNASTERERLLTHVIFSPVLKAANRTLYITYTLTISVSRTVT